MVEDAGDKFRQLLVLAVAVDGEGVRWYGSVDLTLSATLSILRSPLIHTLWRREVDDVTIRLEHVDLFDGLDWLHIHLLESCLKLLVVRACGFMHLLDLSPWCAFASVVLTLAIMLALLSMLRGRRRLHTREMWKRRMSYPVNSLAHAFFTLGYGRVWSTLYVQRGGDIPMRTAFCIRASFSWSMMAVEEVTEPLKRLETGLGGFVRPTLSRSLRAIAARSSTIMEEECAASET